MLDRKPAPVDPARLAIDDILAAGEQMGASPVAKAEAIRSWRDDVLAKGQATYQEAPERRADWYWDNRARLENDVAEAQRKLLGEEANRIASEVYADPTEQIEAWKRIDAAKFDPEELFSVKDRAILNRWLETVEGGEWELPTSSVGEIRNEPIRAGETTLATYDVRPGEDGEIEARVKLGTDITDPSAPSRILRLPDIDETRIEREKAEARMARENREATLAKPVRIPRGQGTYEDRPRTPKEIEGDRELFRLRMREAALESPGAARVLLHEDIEQALKDDPDLGGKIGQVEPTEDFWRGMINATLRTGYAVDDLAKLVKGDDEGIYSAEDAGKVVEALQAVEAVVPGSTRWQFDGNWFERGLRQGVQSFGEMVPSLVGPQIGTKLALKAAGKGALNPGNLSMVAGVSPNAYGGSLASTDADIASETDPDRRERLVRGRRARAALVAASEVAVEKLFPGQEIFQAARPSIFGKAVSETVSTASGSMTITTYLPTIQGELLRRGIQLPQEGIEEIIQTGIETNVIDPVTIGDYDPAKLEDYLTSFVAGTVGAAGMQIAAAPTIPGAVRQARENSTEAGTPPPPESSPPPESEPPPTDDPPPDPGTETPPPESEPEPEPEPKPAPDPTGSSSATNPVEPAPARYLIGNRIFTRVGWQWREHLPLGREGEGSIPFDPATDPDGLGILRRLESARLKREAGATKSAKLPPPVETQASSPSPPATRNEPGPEATEPAKPGPSETAGEASGGVFAPQSGPRHGSESELYLPDGRVVPFQYEVVEAEEIHQAPENDRDYSTPQERARIERMIQNFRPAIHINNNPTPDTGPSMVDIEGEIQGGNRRDIVNSDPRAYPAYRQYLIERAAEFGIDPAEVERMARPKLIRRLLIPKTDLNRALNDAAVGDIAVIDNAISAARLADDEVQLTAADLFEANPDLAPLAALQRAAAKPLAKLMARKGIIRPNEKSKYLTESGFTDEGARLARLVLLASVIRDKTMLSAVLDTPLETKLISALPALSRMRGRGADIAPLADAVRLEIDRLSIKGKRETTVAEYQSQLSFDLEGVSPSEGTLLLQQLLGEHSSRMTKRIFNALAATVTPLAPGESSLGGGQNRASIAEINADEAALIAQGQAAMGDEFGLFDQQDASYDSPSEGAPAIDPRTGLETHITGPVVTDEQREAGARANARRAAAIREIAESAQQREYSGVDARAAAVARIAEERGLPLIPLSRLGIEIDEDGFDSTSFLEALTPGAEAMPYLDREHGVVYKLFDLRIDRGEDYIGKKLIARREEDGWDVTQTGATLFDSIEKLAVLHAAGALPTEIVGMGAQDAFGYLIIKQPEAQTIEVNPGIRAQAVSTIGGQLVSSRAGLGGELRVFWHEGKPWFLGDLHPGNLMADAEGRPTIIDALIGEIPDAMIRDLPEVAEAIEQARRKQEPEPDDDGQGDLFDVAEPPGSTSTAERDARDLQDLIDKARKRFPKPGGSGLADRAHAERFFTADEFERAFVGFVQAGDFKSAREAVRDSDNAAYVSVLKKFMRGAKAGDPDATKNLEWFRAVVNGTVPEGIDPATERPYGWTPPPSSSPPPRQSPPPSSPPPSGGRSTPPPGGNQGQRSAPPPQPPPPPTPPPRPSGVERFNMQALVFLARQMGNIPQVKRMRPGVRGSYQASDERGQPQNNPRINLNEFIAKGGWDEAARTLAHEIGHFIDYLVAAVKHADLAKRLSPLQQTAREFVSLMDGQNGKISAEGLKILKEEAIALSKIMRGDFSPQNPYRNASVELYADFVSAIFIDPELAFDTAPFMSHAWFAALEQKPEAYDAYHLLQDLIKGNSLHLAIRESRTEEEKEALGRVIERGIQRIARTLHWSKITPGIVGNFWSRYTPAGAKKAARSGWWDTGFNFVGRWWESVTNPKERDFVARMEGNEIYPAQQSSALHAKIDRDVNRVLAMHGISHTQLSEYMTARQVLDEDTATLAYLRNNPDEFRAFLTWIADVSGRDGYLDEISSTDDMDLDDLGARLVGELQVTGEFERVTEKAQWVGSPDIAHRGMFAFDIARYQWNEGGLTPDGARQSLDFIKDELGDHRFAILEKAARDFHAAIMPIVREARAAGLFTDWVWKEKIEPNLENYVPRMVLEFLTGDVSATIRQRRGSVKNTLPKHIAKEVQAFALTNRIARQREMQFIFEQASDMGWSSEIEIIPADKFNSKEDLIKEAKSEGKAVRGFFKNGKWHWAIFNDPVVIDVMTKVDLGPGMQALYHTLKRNENFWRLMMTVFRMSFTLVNNPTRMGLELPFVYGPKTLVEAVRKSPVAWNWAKASLGLEAPTDEVIELVERGVLMPFGQYTSADLTVGTDQMIENVLSGASAFSSLKHGSQTKLDKAITTAAEAPGIRQALAVLGMLTGTVEALPKIAADAVLEGRGVPEWERTRLARNEGIPMTGNSAGKLGTLAGVIFMFYRVAIQGARRMATIPFHPRTRVGFALGVLAYNVLPKAFYLAAASGVIDALFGGDDDDERQVDWQEAYTRISRYKIAHSDALFLGWLTPEGQYEKPWGHSSIPANWTPIMKRFPFSETGRHTAPIASFALWNWTDNPLKSDDLGRDFRDIVGTFAVDANPVFGATWTQIANPRPPRDPFSGRDIVSEDQWEAGKFSRLAGMGRYYLEQTPVGDFLPPPPALVNADLPDWASALMRVPGAKAFVALENDALAADYWKRVEDQEDASRRARLMRGPRTAEATRLLSRLEQIKPETRTPAESAKIEILRQWQSGAYEDLMTPLRAKAAGMDIETDWAKETLEESADEVLKLVGTLER